MILLQRYVSNLDDASRALGGDDQPSIRLSIPSAKRPGFFSQVHYRTDERCAFVQMRGWWLYVATPVGLECYPELTALLANAPTLGRQATLKRLEDLRLLAFVVFCESSDEVSFGRSLDGFGSLFFANQPSRLIISDSRLRVAESSGHVKLSREDEGFWSDQARLHPEASFYDQVNRCFAGVRYCADSAEPTKVSRHLMAASSQPLNQADSVRLLHGGLLEVFSTYGDKRIALRLSGGIDSRVLLVGLLEAVRRGILRREQVLCVSVLFPGLDCDESDEIRQIIRSAGFEWAGIVAAADRVREAYEHCLQLPAPPYPTSFIGALCLAEAKKRGARIMLSGHGGDEIFDFNLTDLLGGSLIDRTRRVRLIRQHRNTDGLVAEFKALASVCFGRHVLRSTRRMMDGFGLEAMTMHVHRLGMRIALAQSSGYELSACNVAAAGMLVDVPFLRGPFFPRFDPAVWMLESADEYKVVATSYIRARAPELFAVRARKVFFDSALDKHFQARVVNCDELDGNGARSYAAMRVYADWRSRGTI